MASKSLSIRLSVEDQETVRRALERLGRDGQAALRRIEGAAEAPSRRLLALNTAAATARGGIAGLATAATSLQGALAAVGVGLVIRNIVQTSVEFERLQASLVTVTGSAEAAETAFAGLQNFAATTPFQLREVVEAFARMKALGLDPSEAALTSYGNTAAAMGKSLTQAIEAVADATTGEFERLKEFGIRSSSEGDRVTFTFRGVSTEVGKNAAEIEAYLRRIGEVEFAGGMERQAATLGGALSNLSDSWDVFANEVGQGGLSAALADIAREMASTAGQSDSLARDLGAGLGTAFRTAGEAAKFLGENLDVVVPVMGALLGMRVGAVFGPWGAAIGGVAGALATFAIEADTSALAAERFTASMRVQTGILDESRESTVKLLEAKIAMLEFEQSGLRKMATIGPGNTNTPEDFAQIMVALDAADLALERNRATLARLKAEAADAGTGGSGSGSGSGTGSGSGSGSARSQAKTEAEKQAEAIRRVVESLEFETAQLTRTGREAAVMSAWRQAGIDESHEQAGAVRAAAEANFELSEASRMLDEIMRGGAESADLFGTATKDATNEAKGMESAILGGLTHALTSLRGDFSNLGEVAVSVLQHIITELIRMQDVANASGKSGPLSGIFDIVGGLIGGIGGGGPAALAGGYTPSPVGTSFGGGGGGGLFGIYGKGAAFRDGRVEAFAGGGAFRNGIVDRPTLFPMADGAGLMGEAGPEAVMPLARLRDGSLGVRAGGAGEGSAAGDPGRVVVRLELAGDIDARIAETSRRVSVEVVRQQSPEIQRQAVDRARSTFDREHLFNGAT